MGLVAQHLDQLRACLFAGSHLLTSESLYVCYHLNFCMSICLFACLSVMLRGPRHLKIKSNLTTPYLL